MTTEARLWQEQDVERTVAAGASVAAACLVIHLGDDQSNNLGGEGIPREEHRSRHPEREVREDKSSGLLKVV